MPRLIQNANFSVSLSSSEANANHTADFLVRGVEPFKPDASWTDPEGYRFLRSLDGKQIRLVHGDTSVYYVKLRHAADILPGRSHVTQVGVWRSKQPQHYPVVNGLAARVFAWLLSQYAIVISDNEQTGAGAYFWSERITWAIALPDQHAYFLDGSIEDAEPVEITSTDEFEKIWNDARPGYHWGADADYHMHRLFIISGQPLNG
ncbi:hypothetical protein EAN04_24530 [Salmonella enterica]|nr:hypothetical protein [Salmonella enterica]